MSNEQTGKVLKLEQNQNGRDFVVGDIHGNFDLFERLLLELDFNPENDRILSVGDSIDRGPDSHKAIGYYDNPWFYSVLGNHEEMLISAQAREYGIYEMWMQNGGDWSDNVPDDTLAEMSVFYQTLPLAIQVETEFGTVGIVHADVPREFSWPVLIEALENNTLSKRETKALMWSRDSYRKLRMAREYPGALKEVDIDDVHRVYVGHSIVNTPASYGNMMFIDTGAYSSGKLTAVDLSNEEVIVYGTS